VQGRTAFDKGEEEVYAETLQILVEAGADPNDPRHY